MRVLLTLGQLVGTAWHDAGSVVDLPDDRAARLIERGHARPAPPPIETAVRKHPVRKAARW